jgi:uncharacterized repeat protein (TIGR01451 family)
MTARVSPELPGWNVVLYRDTECTGTMGAGEDLLPAEVALAPDDVLCLIAKVFVPANAPPGAQHRLSLAASFRHEGAQAPIDFSLLHEDLTTVGSAGAALRLTKQADRSDAMPGELITYAIHYRNDGTGALKDLRIFDTTPGHTRFVAAECGVLPAGTSNCSVATKPAAGSAGRVEWRIDGAMQAGASSTVSFTVRIEPR